MPGPLLAAAVPIVGGAIDALSTANQNKKSRKFALEMYERQKADNIRFWQMQNEYNSPQAQMNRFQEAGLNPNLVYGQGNSGNAGSVATPDVKSPEFRVPEFGRHIADGLQNYYDTQIKQASLDNLKKQGTVLDEEALLKAATTRQTEAQTAMSSFNLGLEQDLRETSLDFRRQTLLQLKQAMDLSIRKDAREAAANSTSIQEAIERMKSMAIQRGATKAQINEINERIKLLSKDGTIKDMEIALKKQGMTWSDPLWTRLTSQLIDKIFSGGSIDALYNSFKSEPSAQDSNFMRSLLFGSGFRAPLTPLPHK